MTRDLPGGLTDHAAGCQSGVRHVARSRLRVARLAGRTCSISSMCCRKNWTSEFIDAIIFWLQRQQGLTSIAAWSCYKGLQNYCG